MSSIITMLSQLNLNLKCNQIWDNEIKYLLNILSNLTQFFQLNFKIKGNQKLDTGIKDVTILYLIESYIK